MPFSFFLFRRDLRGRAVICKGFVCLIAFLDKKLQVTAAYPQQRNSVDWDICTFDFTYVRVDCCMSRFVAYLRLLDDTQQ